MKTTIKIVVVIVLFALCSNVSAQNFKMGYIDMDALIPTMSEYDTAMVKMQKFVQELQSELEVMNVERNRKIEEFTKNQTWTDLVRQSKEQEILFMNQNIERFQQQAQESYQQKEAELMQPIHEKANKAIETIAKEQSITYVISANPQILHFKAVGTVDLLPAVKKHLGITK